MIKRDSSSERDKGEEEALIQSTMSKWIPARELIITGIEDKRCWVWTHPPGCTSTVVAELRNATLLDIIAKMDVKNLLKNTSFGAYLVFKLKEGSKGLERAKASVRYVVDKVDGVDDQAATVFLVDKKEANEFGQVPQPLKYGWKEIKLGDFTNDDGDEGVVKMRLFETNKHNPKSGLIVKGVEIRPIGSVRYVVDKVDGVDDQAKTVFLVGKKEAIEFGQVPEPLKYFTINDDEDEGRVKMRLFETSTIQSPVLSSKELKFVRFNRTSQ